MAYCGCKHAEPLRSEPIELSKDPIVKPGAGQSITTYMLLLLSGNQRFLVSAHVVQSPSFCPSSSVCPCASVTFFLSQF